MNKINIQKIKDALTQGQIDFDKIEIQDRTEEYSEKFVNLLTEEQVIECMKYIDDNETVNDCKLNFLETIADLDYVKAKYIGVERIYDEQTAPTNTYIVRIGRNGKSISFKFHNSYMDTLQGYTVNLYYVLSFVTLDGRMEVDTFEDFINTFTDENEDSIKSQKLYKAVKKQKEKILKIFSEYELVDFPQ